MTQTKLIVSPGLEAYDVSVTDYIAAARAKHDDDLFFGLIASAMVIIDGQTLLVRRAPTDSFPLCWEVPGGMADDGETVLEAAARELYEEAGLVAVRARALVDMAEWICESGKRDGTQERWHKFVFLMEVEGGKTVDGKREKPVVKLDPEEHCEFLWATEDEVRKNRCGGVDLKWTWAATHKAPILKAFSMTDA
jgi:8-oxo-dGTP pyrophosphatase MutT (NUDIX family)